MLYLLTVVGNCAIIKESNGYLRPQSALTRAKRQPISPAQRFGQRR